MKIIVGLGNPGEKYEKSRHNLGFQALDTLLAKLEPLDKTFWEAKKDFKAEIKQLKHPSKTRLDKGGKDATLLLVKPATFMNNSGDAVSKILSFYKVDPQDLTVIHDDLDLPFGKIRIRFGGGAGGHHGVESILAAIGTDKFLRIRLGIGNPRRAESKGAKTRNYKDVDDHVLGTIRSTERSTVKHMLKQVVRDIELILSHGIETYMSRYNK